MYRCIHAYMHTYITLHYITLHTYRHTYTHTHIYIDMYVYIPLTSQFCPEYHNKMVVDDQEANRFSAQPNFLFWWQRASSCLLVLRSALHTPRSSWKPENQKVATPTILVA